jgi:hypothetical protein
VRPYQLAQNIADAIRGFDPKEVVNVAYEIGYDSTDDPSIFFRIVLTDEASSERRLAVVAERVTSRLITSIRPLENWGLIPYFSFRSFSEQRKLNDPRWS